MDERIYGSATEAAPAGRSWRVGVARGFRRRCPQCGEDRLFDGLLTARPGCGVCGLDFSGHRADDMPPYLTIFVVGHVMIPFVLLAERAFEPSTLFSILVWSILALGLSLALLPRIKGAVIGMQWAHEMHGFGPGDDWADAPAPEVDAGAAAPWREKV